MRNTKSTDNYYVHNYNYCSYCNTWLLPTDIWDEYGGYCGCYYVCDCEQGKIEQEMNSKIFEVEKQIEEIKNQYASRLFIDEEKKNRIMYELEIEHLKEMYNIDQPEDEYCEEND